MDDRELALALAAWLEEHLTDELRGPDLERISGYSGNRVRQKFYTVTGETPSGYVRKRRLTEAARAILAGEPLVEVADRFGYSSQENFGTAFKAWFGLNPGEFRTLDGRWRYVLTRMKEPLSIVEIKNLYQQPLCTTLMSCAKGACDHFDIDWSVPKLFGYGSMGFLVNIHQDLCPSGPYVWNKNSFWLQLRNMGLRYVETLNLVKDTPQAERDRVGQRLKSWLDAGKLVMLEFLENQLVSGYDDQGLIFLRSWGPQSPTEISKLSFGSWAECLDREGWVYFTLLEPESQRADEATLLQGALATALRLRSDPASFACPGYQVGDAAWGQWLDCLERGLGTSHGHWWNAMVWTECRRMTAGFFGEIAPTLGSEARQALARELAEVYGACADSLETVALRDAAPGPDGRRPAPELAVQLQGIRRCRELDARAEGLIRQLVALL